MEKLTRVLTQAAMESLGMKNKWCQKKKLRKWNNNLTQIINDKRVAFMTYLSTETQADKIEYDRCRTTAKTVVCQNRCDTWNNFVEHDIRKPKPTAYKMIRILNNDIVEHVKINPIKEQTWLNYFQDLWSRQSEILIQQQPNNRYTEAITEEELDTALGN
jgi:hypothetical protein